MIESQSRRGKAFQHFPHPMLGLLPTPDEVTLHVLTISAAFEHVQSGRLAQEGSPFPRFDLAIASSLAEIDQIIRPSTENYSLVRARGAIILAAPPEKVRFDLSASVGS